MQLATQVGMIAISYTLGTTPWENCEPCRKIGKTIGNPSGQDCTIFILFFFYSISIVHKYFLRILLEDLIFSIFRGPIELALGIILGSLAGVMCWFFPNKSEVRISLCYCLS